MIGAGGSEGWEHLELIKRSKAKVNQLDNKQEMDCIKYKKFFEATCVKVQKRHEKLAAILDDASYDNVKVS